MPSINMIAPRRAEKRRLERDMRRLAAVILLELVFGACLGGWFCTKLWTTSNRLAEINTQLNKLQPKVEEIESNEAATAALKPKLDLLNQAKARTMRWYTTLDKLTMSMPSETYLTRISTVKSTPEDTAVNVNLNGVAPSQSRVGEAMIRLQNVPDFQTVDLHFTQKTTVGDLPAVEFEIGAAMKPVDQPKEGGANGTGQS
jgi:Tfp pilus assembly protein PilN